MVQYVRAKCTKCGNVIVLRFEEEPAPPVEKGDIFESKCPICKEKTPFETLSTPKSYT